MKNLGKTAIVIGATGLVGKHLLDLLQYDLNYSSVIVLARSPLKTEYDPKIQFIQTDFNDNELLKKVVKGDDLFCCIGTTRRKARNMQTYRFVDYEIPVKIARLAKENGAKAVICVSSIGADPDSSSFYLQLKGEMEYAIRTIQFPLTAFLRPSLLLGDREEKRVAEDLAKKLFKFTNFFFIGNMKKYKPIKASTVALGMLIIARGEYKETVFENVRIKEITGDRS